VLSPIPEHLESNRVLGFESESESSGFKSESESWVLKISTRVGLEYTAGLEYYITAQLAAIAFSQLGQYVNSPGHRTYCYTELAVFFPSISRNHR